MLKHYLDGDKRIYYQQLCSNRYNKSRKNEFVRNRLRLESIDYYWLYVKSD